MMSRSGGRGRWQRVIEARRESRKALGGDPDQTDLFDGPPRRKTPPYVPATKPATLDRPSETVGVLLLSEAAIQLGVTRSELEAMINTGKIQALPTGFTRTIPSSEVERILTNRR